jgi:cobalt/nickel transport system permease protein
MHIPNGFLDPKVSAGTAFAAAGVLGYCISKVRQALSYAVPEALLSGAGNFAVNISDRSKKIVSSLAENHIMKMGAVASLIFAAQMFNFPINNGTSGHLLGGVIAAIALGPFSGTIAISVVLIIQSLIFADGGITALGANILNMAVIGTFASYYIYYFINKLIRNDLGFNLGIFFAAFFSVLFASIACALEIGLSGTIALNRIIPAMAYVHARIGLAEAILSIIAIEFLSLMKIELEGRVIHEKK